MVDEDSGLKFWLEKTFAAFLIKNYINDYKILSE